MTDHMRDELIRLHDEGRLRVGSGHRHMGDGSIAHTTARALHHRGLVEYRYDFCEHHEWVVPSGQPIAASKHEAANGSEGHEGIPVTESEGDR